MVFKNVKYLSVGIFDGYDFDCKFSSGVFSGYTHELMKLLELYNVSIHYRKVCYQNNITELLLTKELDILACHPDNEFSLHSGIAPLITTLQSDYVLIYDPNKLSFTKDIFILTFAGTLWICFLAVLIVLAFCLHLSTKWYSRLHSKFEPWSFVDITLWGNAAACQQGLSHTPEGFASRAIFFLGYLISYLLYTGFAAGITSLLLQQGMGKRITAKDIQKMDIKIVTLKNHEYYGAASLSKLNPLGMRPKYLQNGITSVSSIDDVFVHINHQNVVGVLPKLLVEQYYAKNLKCQSTQIHATSKIPNALFSRSFLMRKDSAYKTINKILLKLKQSGLLKKILRESLLISPIISMSKYSSAGIEHVGSAIMILVVGAMSSTIFLVFELIFALYSGKL